MQKTKWSWRQLFPLSFALYCTSRCLQLKGLIIKTLFKGEVFFFLSRSKNLFCDSGMLLAVGVVFLQLNT